MAPFLVILLLLALGAGIVAWHTIGYPHVPISARRQAQEPVQAVEDASAPVPEPVFAPTLDTPATVPNRPAPARAGDPFAHAPSFDGEARP